MMVPQCLHPEVNEEEKVQNARKHPFSYNSGRIEYIDKLGKQGINAETVIKNIEFSMAVGTDYFPEIAKLRALRILFYKIAESYGVSNYDPGDLNIHSISTGWTKTLYDPYVNMDYY